MVIAVVALVVIGPERLPKVARTVGHLMGRLQRYVSDVKADINREIQLDELKKLQQQIMDQSSAVQTRVRQEIGAVESSWNETVAPVDTVNDQPTAVAAIDLPSAAALAVATTDPLTVPPVEAPLTVKS